ncbi:hypothetical protein Tco_0093842 [Tanacetum coccineum]
MVAYLEKSTGSAGFHQIIDFITRSHIYYALTKKPEVCVSYIKQFWRTAEIVTDDDGSVKIHASIDGHSLSISEGSLRRHLKLDGQDGITSLPPTEIFAQLLALDGICTNSDKVKPFKKVHFIPLKCRFLIHNILHCLSPKKTAWEQYSRQEVELFPNMLNAVESSPSRSTSSPSPTPTSSPTPESTHAPPSPQPPTPQPSPPQPSPPQPSPTHLGSDYHPPTPIFTTHAVHNTMKVGVLEADLTKTKQTYSSAYTKLILRVKKLEAQIKVGKARRHSRFVLSDAEDDSSKQGRKFSKEGFKDDEGGHEKASTETELFIQEITPTEVIHEQEGSGKSSDQISTAGKKKDTASEEVPPVSLLRMSYNEVKVLFEKAWDFNQKASAMDAENASKKQMSPEKEKPQKRIMKEKAVNHREKGRSSQRSQQQEEEVPS